MAKTVITGLWLAALMLTSVSCLDDNGTIGRPEISVVSENLTTNADGQTVLIVTIKNTGPVTAELAEVSVKFFGAGKTLLDSGRDSIMNLEREKTWQFIIPCDDSSGKITAYELTATAASGK